MPNFTSSTPVKVPYPWIKYLDPATIKNRVNALGDIMIPIQKVYNISEAAYVAQQAGAAMPLAIHDFGDDDLEDIFDTRLDRMDIADMSLDTSDDAKAQYNAAKESVASNISERSFVDTKREQYKALQKKGIRTSQEMYLAAGWAWMLEENGKLDLEDPRGLLPRKSYNDFSRSNEDDYIRFVHPGTVKRAISSSYPSGTEINAYNDVNRARISGLLQSRSTTLLLYSTPAPGLTWPLSSCRVEHYMIDIDKWVPMLNPRFKGRWDKSHCGVLLIQNRQRFEELYKDTAKARYDSGSLGNYLDHLYAVPMNGNGVAMLREIMLYTIRQSLDDSKEEAMDRDFAKKLGGVFELNDEFHDEIFQLKIHIDGSEDPT